MRIIVLLVIAVIAGCGGDDDDTLEPLPIEGATIGSSSTVSGSSPESSLARTTTTTTTAVAPVGDWDGARFDAGTIATVSELGGYRAIGFDRYSFSDPTLGTVDAEGFVAEPVVAWWRESPFSNVRVQLRTFVLDPDVEVLVLDEGDRAMACTDPPTATPPSPSWDVVEASVLEDPAAAASIATLTYSPTGQVTRIRFTAGC